MARTKVQLIINAENEQELNSISKFLDMGFTFGYQFTLVNMRNVNFGDGTIQQIRNYKKNK